MAFSWISTGLNTAMAISSIPYLLVLWMLYRLSRALYNISSFHPLSHVPGPKLAAMTTLYEFWYDMILGGTYTKCIAAMHTAYGK